MHTFHGSFALAGTYEKIVFFLQVFVVFLGKVACSSLVIVEANSALLLYLGLYRVLNLPDVQVANFTVLCLL